MTIQLLGSHAKECHVAQLCNPKSGLHELLERCATIVNGQSGGKLLGLFPSKGIQGAIVATDLCLLCRQLIESGKRVYTKLFFHRETLNIQILIFKKNLKLLLTETLTHLHRVHPQVLVMNSK